MHRRPIWKMARIAAALILLLAVVLVAGCVRVSGGTWYIRSAATPAGWPELTPVGKVQLRTYPAYRAAVVDEVRMPGGDMEPMFMALFRHIQTNDVAMTAPVAMGYDRSDGDAPDMASMAFLYRTADLGRTTDEGIVHVRDVPPQTFASVGVRGDYTDENFARGLALLDAWLKANTAAAVPVGPPRYLGYNGPFTPSFMRYGEVQVPVEVVP